MRVILFIMQKEFIQVFRNRMMLPILFMLPIVQLLILVNAATYEMKNIRIAFVDYDHSTLSKHFISKIKGSNYFIVGDNQPSVSNALKAIDENKVTAVIVIPKEFEKRLKTNSFPLKIQVLIDAINSVNATISYSYINQIFLSIKNDNFFVKQKFIQPAQIINVIPRYRYNADFDYKKYMVPGVLVMLVTLISFMLGALNIVREKEV
ncbi:MAG TPA: ABC transporter permease, partial [Bacteroidales bacterium]|nr:ABC transporter permease [Bacteroidales bacterium]